MFEIVEMATKSYENIHKPFMYCDDKTILNPGDSSRYEARGKASIAELLK